jgi:hypothetical protein
MKSTGWIDLIAMQSRLRQTEQMKPAPRRLNFLAGQISVPDDFDAMGRRKIEELSAVPSGNC